MFGMARFGTTLFLFRRDLRLQDNTALREACADSRRVIPAFLFTDEEAVALAEERAEPRQLACIARSLLELDELLRKRGSRLVLGAGAPAAFLVGMRDAGGAIDAVMMNTSSDPGVSLLERELEAACAQLRIPLLTYTDTTLSPIERVLTREGKPYVVFSPFFERARSFAVAKPHLGSSDVFGRLRVQPHGSKELLDACDHLAQATQSLFGGRRDGLSKLRDVPSLIAHYGDTKDMPALEGTSLLSTHHACGTVSIRETFARACTTGGRNCERFMRQLYWRDFFYHVAHFSPFVFSKALFPWGESLQWANDQTQFDAWCQGMTGIPLVDAGMREMRETGLMHGRTRMLVASFLTKNLLIDWRWGARYFERALLDIDMAINISSWQWCASVGVDPRPVRILNPYTQAAKHDPTGEYIQRWVPELRDVSVHLLCDGKERDFSVHAPRYVPPIVSVRASFHTARERYAEARSPVRRVPR